MSAVHTASLTSPFPAMSLAIIPCQRVTYRTLMREEGTAADGERAGQWISRIRVTKKCQHCCRQRKSWTVNVQVQSDQEMLALLQTEKELDSECPRSE